MNFQEILDKYLKKFSSETKLKESVAKKIMKMIQEMTKDVDNVSLEDFGIILSNLKYRLRSGIDMTSLLNKAKDEDIKAVIGELIKWRTRDDLLSDCAPCESKYNEGDRAMWFFESLAFSDKELKAGDVVDIQIMRVGKWNHPMYGEVKVDEKVLKGVKKNFDNKERGIELAVDENHEDNHKALGWFKELYFQGKKNLFAKIELTKKGAELINEGAYRYFSPEIVFKKVDEESGDVISNLLIGGAFTNRPFFKAMQPLMASEDGGVSNNNEGKNSHNTNILYFNNSEKMNKFLRLLAKLSMQEKVSDKEFKELEAAFNEMSDADKSEEMKTAFNEVQTKFNEDGGDDSDEGADDEAADGSDDDQEGGDADDDQDSDEGDDEGSDDDADEGDDAADDSDDSDDAEGGVKASEGKNGKVFHLDEKTYKGLKKQAATAAKLVQEAKFAETKERVEKLTFSENNKIGVALPKHKEKITKFAAGLSDGNRKVFFSILENLQTVAASEVGSDGAPAEKFNDEEVKYLMKTMNFSEEQAKAALSGKEFKETSDTK